MTTIRSLKSFFLGSIAIFALSMSPPQTNGTEESKPEPGEKSVAELQQQRLAVLQELVNVAFTAYRTGEADIAQGMQAQQQLLNAKLELAEDRESRLKILSESVELAAEWQKVAEARYRAAESSQADVLQCRARRLEAEIALVRETKDQE